MNPVKQFQKVKVIAFLLGLVLSLLLRTNRQQNVKTLQTFIVLVTVKIVASAKTINTPVQMIQTATLEIKFAKTFSVFQTKQI
jgi:hypothetical protein